MSKRVAFLYVLLLILIIFKIISHFKFSYELKKIEESTQIYGNELNTRKDILNSIDSLKLKKLELLRSISEIDIMSTFQSKVDEKNQEMHTLKEEKSMNLVNSDSDDKTTQMSGIDKDSIEALTPPKKINFTSISEVYVKDKFEKHIPLKTDYIYLRLISKSRTDEITSSINSITLNGKEIKILESKMEIITSTKKTKVYSYLLKLDVKEKTIIPGVNEILLKSGIIIYVKTFISH